MRPPPRRVSLAAALCLGAGIAGCGAAGQGSPTAGAAAHTTPATGVSGAAAVDGRHGSGSARATGSEASNGAVAFAQATLAIPAGNGGNGIAAGQQLRIPRGWHAEVWARVARARLEAWTPQGDLLVSQPTNGTVTELIPRARNRAAPPAQRVVLRGLDGPQGLALTRIGRREVLFVAEEDAVERYDWTASGPRHRRVIVSGLPDTAPAGSDNHTLKNVVVAPNGRIVIDIGSGSNASAPAATNPPRAAVVSYTSNGTGMRIVATGVRNGDGLSYAPDGTLWAAVNERDQIPYPFHRAFDGVTDAYGQVIPAYVDEHPPDEVARLSPGRDLGWPYCDPDPDPAGGALRYADMRFTDDVDTNPTGRELDCARLTPLDRGIPAHSAPLGFHFLTGSKLPARWRAGAILAVHGSWDRQPPRAPAILWLPWNARTRTLGAPITLIGGFQDVDGTRWGRTADAVPGPDGALYVSDDTADAIYRIVP